MKRHPSLQPLSRDHHEVYWFSDIGHPGHRPDCPLPRTVGARFAWHLGSQSRPGIGCAAPLAHGRSPCQSVSHVPSWRAQAVDLGPALSFAIDLHTGARRSETTGRCRWPAMKGARLPLDSQVWWKSSCGSMLGRSRKHKPGTADGIFGLYIRSCSMARARAALRGSKGSRNGGR